MYLQIADPHLRGRDSAVAAKDALIDEGSDRHAVHDGTEPVPHLVTVVTELVQDLAFESELQVHGPRLMIATQQDHVTGREALEGEEVEEDFD